MTGNKTPSVLSFSFFLVLFYLCSSITSFQRSRSCGLSPFTWKLSLYYLSSFYYNGQKISILLPAIMFSLLGGYRALYLLNWIYRYSTEPGYSQWIVWISGLVQTLLYCDFFYYYLESWRKNERLTLPS